MSTGSPRSRTWRAVLFPDPPRKIPHARFLNVSCRTVHLAAFGLLLGGHAWDVEAGRLLVALWMTIASGLALMTLELLATVHWLLEARGLMVLLKLGLLLFVPLAWDHRVPLLLAVVAIASVGSHMPARFRHASLLSALGVGRDALGLMSAGTADSGRLMSTGVLGKGGRP